MNNTDVKRLGPSRRISSKRTQTQCKLLFLCIGIIKFIYLAIQTQTVVASLILNDKYKHIDEGTQTVRINLINFKTFSRFC